jgi:hypothetical protein
MFSALALSSSAMTAVRRGLAAGFGAFADFFAGAFRDGFLFR